MLVPCQETLRCWGVALRPLLQTRSIGGTFPGMTLVAYLPSEETAMASGSTPYARWVSLLVITHERCLDHVAGLQHPERPDRLRAAWSGIDALGLGGDLKRLSARPVELDAIRRVHSAELVEKLAALDAAGGGRLDPDTGMNEHSWDAVRLAAGAGIQGIAALDAGDADAVFCAVRPPGHHATPTRSMGFCFLNNVAVAASALADRGERVLVFDYDAHHGNGTQDVFYEDQRVLFVSLHQMPLYPGSGALDERGRGDGVGTTLNVPMPPGATGDHYRAAWADVIAPSVDRFAPTWLLISAGFDGHRSDPITQLGLSSADLADLTSDALELVPAGRRMVFLEGGYDFDAIRDCTHAVLGALVGERVRVESPTTGGPGAEAVVAASTAHNADELD
jgi:acetoin utilization deacetylase AcuC-like enzyme